MIDDAAPTRVANSSMKSKLVRARRSNSQRVAETRANIINSTVTTLYEVGYSKTTIQEISNRSGVSLGAIQHHFNNKNILILSTLEFLLEDLKSEVKKFSYVKGDAHSRCRSFIDIMWSGYYSRNIYIAVWEIIIGCRAEPELYDLVKLHRADSTDLIYEAWQGLMRVDEKHESLVVVDLALKFMRSASYMNVGVSSRKYIDRQLEILSEMLCCFEYS